MRLRTPDDPPEPVIKRVTTPGKRVARICTACQTRRFDAPDWKCEQHPGKTIVQANVPYRGQPT